MNASVSGSESFGHGERYYHSVCPVSLATRDTGDPGAGVTCPRCDMVWYRWESYIHYQHACHPFYYDSVILYFLNTYMYL